MKSPSITADACSCGSAVPAPLALERPAGEPPIACTLGASDIPVRAEAFRAAFSRLLATERFAGGFRWRFRAMPGFEDELKELARREHDCCRFFDFDVTCVGDEILWEARADDRATAILEEFMQLPETLRGADPQPLKRALSSAGLTFTADTDAMRNE
jgi:hypothetical protein